MLNLQERVAAEGRDLTFKKHFTVHLLALYEWILKFVMCSVSDTNECNILDEFPELTAEIEGLDLPQYCQGPSAQCENIEGSFNCSCQNGYRLLDDGFTCLGELLS